MTLIIQKFYCLVLPAGNLASSCPDHESSPDPDDEFQVEEMALQTKIGKSYN